MNEWMTSGQSITTQVILTLGNVYKTAFLDRNNRDGTIQQFRFFDTVKTDVQDFFENSSQSETESRVNRCRLNNSSHYGNMTSQDG